MTNQPSDDTNSAGQPGSTGPKERDRIRGLVPIAIGVILVLGAGAFGLYGMARPSGKRIARTGACAQSLDAAQAIDPFAHGEVAALTLAKVPNDLGAIAFDDANGMKVTIGSFKGQTILLNLWATWCAPCRQEMPSLDKLQESQGSKAFSVVAVNVDTARLDKPKTFFREIGAKSLSFYADNSADIVQALKGQGLPTTVLIGKDGCEIGTMAGPAQWDSQDAKTLIEKAQDASGAKAASL